MEMRVIMAVGELAMPKKQAEAVLGDLMTLATRHLRTRDKIFRTSLGILHVQNRHAPTG
jgi:DNA-binding protein HU-beta